MLYFVKLNGRFMFYALLAPVNAREMCGLLRTGSWNAVRRVFGEQKLPQGLPLADIIILGSHF